MNKENIIRIDFKKLPFQEQFELFCSWVEKSLIMVEQTKLLMDYYKKFFNQEIKIKTHPLNQINPNQIKESMYMFKGYIDTFIAEISDHNILFQLGRMKYDILKYYNILLNPFLEIDFELYKIKGEDIIKKEFKIKSFKAIKLKALDNKLRKIS